MHLECFYTDHKQNMTFIFDFTFFLKFTLGITFSPVCIRGPNPGELNKIPVNSPSSGEIKVRFSDIYFYMYFCTANTNTNF